MLLSFVHTGCVAVWRLAACFGENDATCSAAPRPSAAQCIRCERTFSELAACCLKISVFGMLFRLVAGAIVTNPLRVFEPQGRHVAPMVWSEFWLRGVEKFYTDNC